MRTEKSQVAEPQGREYEGGNIPHLNLVICQENLIGFPEGSDRFERTR
jgi:hypothetical protein